MRPGARVWGWRGEGEVRTAEGWAGTARRGRGEVDGWESHC